MRSASVRIILCRPRNPDNIGAAARAMANFGFSELAVVDVHTPVWAETIETAVTAGSGQALWLMERARAAVGAAHILRAAKVCNTIEEAAYDCTMLLGTSALHKRTPDRDVVSLPELCGFLTGRMSASKEEKIGILFGSEKTGLLNEDLSHCHAVLNIPACEHQPSINLGQSVALVCYEIFVRSGNKVRSIERPKAPGPAAREIERIVASVEGILKDEGVQGGYAKDIRRSLLDARLTKGAMNILKFLIKRASK